MGGKIEKSHGGPPPGPRGGAEAGVRREAPNGGRSGAPQVDPRVIFQFFHPSWKQSQDTQQKSPRYQANPRYQPKKRRYLYNIIFVNDME